MIPPFTHGVSELSHASRRGLRVRIFNVGLEARENHM